MASYAGGAGIAGHIYFGGGLAAPEPPPRRLGRRPSSYRAL